MDAIEGRGWVRVYVSTTCPWPPTLSGPRMDDQPKGAPSFDCPGTNFSHSIIHSKRHRHLNWKMMYNVAGESICPGATFLRKILLLDSNLKPTLPSGSTSKPFPLAEATNDPATQAKEHLYRQQCHKLSSNNICSEYQDPSIVSSLRFSHCLPHPTPPLPAWPKHPLTKYLLLCPLTVSPFCIPLIALGFEAHRIYYSENNLLCNINLN